MEGSRLHTLLYKHTDSEIWHLKHPGLPSPRYQSVPRVEVGDQLGKHVARKIGGNDQGDALYLSPPAHQPRYGA